MKYVKGNCSESILESVHFISPVFFSPSDSQISKPGESLHLRLIYKILKSNIFYTVMHGLNA